MLQLKAVAKLKTMGSEDNAVPDEASMHMTS